VEFGSIVEGDGERDALPVLLRRIIRDIDPTSYVDVRRPNRYPKGRLKQRSHLSQAVDLAARQLTPPCAVIVLIDADDDCPADLGPRLLEWAQGARDDIPIAVVLAVREYEAWFLAAAQSLGGHRGLAANLVAPSDPETISGAKEWLSRNMPRAQPYNPTRHQASFSQVMSLEQARNAPSFDKLCRDVRRLVEALTASDV
jgi:hypothetical protein